MEKRRTARKTPGRPVGRPKKPAGEKSVTVSLVLPPAVAARLDAEAARRGVSRSAVAAEIFERANSLRGR